MGAESGRVDGTDPEGPVRQVEALDAVCVPHELRDDLAEAERHDRQVVAPQPKCRQPDQDPSDGGEPRGAQRTSQIEMWMPFCSR